MCTVAHTHTQKGCLMEYFSRASEDPAFLWTIWGLMKMQATQQHSALRNKSLLLASASPLKRLVKVSLCKFNHCTKLPEACSIFKRGCNQEMQNMQSQHVCRPEAHFIPCIFYNREKMWAKSSRSHACSACMQITCDTFLFYVALPALPWRSSYHHV